MGFGGILQDVLSTVAIRWAILGRRGNRGCVVKK